MCEEGCGLFRLLVWSLIFRMNGMNELSSGVVDEESRRARQKKNFPGYDGKTVME